MKPNEEIVHRFYTAFQQLDYKSMQECYSEDAVFSDPAFGLLGGEEVKAMWEMLCTRAKDFSLTFSNIQLLDEEYATCNWTARYIFSKTGRRVVNDIKAHMRIQNGKIIEHSDAFKLSKWSAQALGWKGSLLGWTGFMKRRIQGSAKRSLVEFMGRKE
jgi:ketosteroid isomerase-like protein